jgi:branched-chain amino acid transport system ATP-binding protein
MNEILVIKDLSKSFGAVTASDGVNFSLQEGEIHALIGPNGAGKSTLVKQIIGEIKQDTGSILLDGLELSNYNIPMRIRLGLARTFQITNVISDFSIFQNVLLAMIGKAKKEFNFFSMAENSKTMVEKVDKTLKEIELLGEKNKIAAKLSHGERRQLEIGLALALDPKVILLDEPMAGLSADIVERMKQSFKNIKNKVPILLIEHDMDVVFSIADRISVLVNGKIIATGTAKDIKMNTEVRKAYLGIDE